MGPSLAKSKLKLVKGGAGENEGAPQPWAIADPAEGHRGVTFTAHWSAQHRALSAKTVPPLRSNASDTILVARVPYRPENATKPRKLPTQLAFRVSPGWLFECLRLKFWLKATHTNCFLISSQAPVMLNTDMAAIAN